MTTSKAAACGSRSNSKALTSDRAPGHTRGLGRVLCGFEASSEHQLGVLLTFALELCEYSVREFG